MLADELIRNVIDFGQPFKNQSFSFVSIRQFQRHLQLLKDIKSRTSASWSLLLRPHELLTF